MNQLAALYHWPGISGAKSEGILKRLQIIANRPLVSVQLIRTREPTDADGFQTVASTQEADAIAVDLMQARSGSDPTSMRTTLAVTHYFGCLWIHF